MDGLILFMFGKFIELEITRMAAQKDDKCDICIICPL